MRKIYHYVKLYKVAMYLCPSNIQTLPSLAYFRQCYERNGGEE
jgi:hypothetical protein